MDYRKVEEILYASDYLAWLSHVFCGDIHLSSMKRTNIYSQTVGSSKIEPLTSRKINDQQELFYV